MDINWGYNISNDNQTKQRNKKRKYSNISDSKRYIEIENDLIYTIGTQIYFTSPINKQSISLLIKEITKIIDEKGKNKKLTICYVVDSPGGCVTSVLKFVDFLNIIKTKYKNVEFVSIGTGLIASAGTIMCAVADKRYITKHAYAMIHELSTGNSGKFTHFVSYTSHLKKMHDQLVNIYYEKSNMSIEDIEVLLKNETWFNAEEYLEKGLVDEIK